MHERDSNNTKDVAQNRNEILIELSILSKAKSE